MMSLCGIKIESVDHCPCVCFPGPWLCSCAQKCRPQIRHRCPQPSVCGRCHCGVQTLGSPCPSSPVQTRPTQPGGSTEFLCHLGSEATCQNIIWRSFLEQTGWPKEFSYQFLKKPVTDLTTTIWLRIGEQSLCGLCTWVWLPVACIESKSLVLSRLLCVLCVFGNCELNRWLLILCFRPRLTDT